MIFSASLRFNHLNLVGRDLFPRPARGIPLKVLDRVEDLVVREKRILGKHHIFGLCRGRGGDRFGRPPIRPDPARRPMGDLIEEIGQIDILVNCAGWDSLMPFLKTDESFWDRIIDLNFKGTLRTTHACLPGMIDRQWGRVVNIASDAGRVGSSHEAVYSGAKGGVIAFSKTIAREMVRHGITVNSVCPGPTDTALLDEIIGASRDGSRVIESMTHNVPMRRLGTPADVAAAVCFLASEEAGYITGQTLSVSGGLTMA